MYQGLPWFLSQKGTPGASSWGCLCAGAQVCCSALALQFCLLGADSIDVPEYRVGPRLLWALTDGGPESEGFETLSTHFLLGKLGKPHLLQAFLFYLNH